MKNRFLVYLVLGLILSGCGAAVCPDQASCPDGSWEVGPAAAGTGSFVDFIGSMIHRDKTARQMTLKQELEGTLFAGNRIVPDLNLDNDAYTGGSVTYATRPSQVCGTTQNTVTDRITHCALLNASLASWDGAANGNAGQGLWKLVTYNGTHEVWRDERTNLVWSDRLGSTNWCRASGNSGGGPYGQVDPSNYCDSIIYQDQVTPESWCTEDPAFNTPVASDSMKAGMRLAASASSPSVIWRLPTKGDFHQAELDGIRFVLPNLTAGVGHSWSATVWLIGNSYAYHFDGRDGLLTSIRFRSDALPSVRCVGD